MENLRLALLDDEVDHGDRIARHLRRCQIGVERIAEADELGERLAVGCFDAVVVAADVALVVEAMESARANGISAPFIVLTDSGRETTLPDTVVLERSAGLPELLSAIERTMNRQWRRVAARVFGH